MPSPELPSQPWWKRELFGLVRSTILLPGVMTILGFAGTLHWRFELFAHFTPVFFCSAFLGALLMLLLRHWRWVLAGSAVVVANGTLLFPCYVPPAQAAANTSTAPLRILTINVLRKNTNYHDVLHYIQEIDPDVLLLQETNAAWCKALAPLRDIYPTHLECPREDDFGAAAFTRLPGARMAELTEATSPGPLIAIEAGEGDDRLTLYNVHASPPVNHESATLRNAQLKELARWIQERDGKVIIGGDLNLTPWSPDYRKFIRASGLHNARLGFGILPTWPQDRKFPLLPYALRFRPFMPIDHVLLPQGTQVLRCERGPNLGSDHRPLVVDILL